MSGGNLTGALDRVRLFFVRNLNPIRCVTILDPYFKLCVTVFSLDCDL